MKADKMRALKLDELQARITELRGQVFGSRIKHATGQLENTAGLRSSRRELARALTIQAERRRSE